MSLYGKPKGKLVRRFGTNIFSNRKFDRLLERKPNLPGKDRNRRYRERISEYRKQLEEKQKLMFAYGLNARQMERLYREAHRRKGVTTDNILRMLELRLDSVVYNAGFAATRAQARQMVNHRHIAVNDRTVDIPSYQVKRGARIAVKDKKGVRTMARNALDASGAGQPDWIRADADALEATVVDEPGLHDFPQFCDARMVVEFYSR